MEWKFLRIEEATSALRLNRTSGFAELRLAGTATNRKARELAIAATQAQDGVVWDLDPCADSEM